MNNLNRDMLILLHDVARMQRTRFDQWARTYGMTRAQGIILARLERQPGLSQNEMAALCEVEPITVGRLVDRLEARGLIERRADPTDRRIRRLHLLPAAAPVLAAIHNYKTALQDYLTEGLDVAVQETLIDALLHMKTKLTMEAAGPARAVGGG
jgi:DNA-binding MarR family transcriptional regulator